MEYICLRDPVSGRRSQESTDDSPHDHKITAVIIHGVGPARLLQGESLYIHSLAIPALMAAVPGDWEKEYCMEYFSSINYDSDASDVGISSMGYDIA